jgi:hypothetical protein
MLRIARTQTRTLLNVIKKLFVYKDIVNAGTLIGVSFVFVLMPAREAGQSRARLRNKSESLAGRKDCIHHINTKSYRPSADG